MPSAVAASTLQDGAAGTATALEAVAGDAFMTRENLGIGRLLGGGASACSSSWTKFLATSCSRSSSASFTTGAGGRGVARSNGFFFCALGASAVDGGGGLAGLLLLSLSRRAGAGAAAAAGTVVVTAALRPARGAGGGGGGAAGRQGKVAYLVAAGGSGRSGGWLDGRRGRDGDEYIGGLAYGSAGAEVHAPPLCRWLYGWSIGKELYAPPGAAGLAPSPRRLRPRDLVLGNSRLPDDRSKRTFSILLIWDERSYFLGLSALFCSKKDTGFRWDC